MFIVKYDDGSMNSVLEHREIMEIHLGKKLSRNEVVHHTDHNKKNNVISNLEVMSRSAHSKLHKGEPELYTFCCPECDNPAVKLAKEVRSNLKKGKKGPFCSRSCAGKANQKFQSPERTPGWTSWKKIKTLTCPICKQDFERPLHKVSEREARGVKNHFCSRDCFHSHQRASFYSHYA